MKSSRRFPPQVFGGQAVGRHHATMSLLGYMRESTLGPDSAMHSDALHMVGVQWQDVFLGVTPGDSMGSVKPHSAVRVES